MGGKAADHTVVLQLGSLSLRFGFANQLAPDVIPNVIAYLSPSPQATTLPVCSTEKVYQACNIVQEHLVSKGFLRDTRQKILLPKKKTKMRITRSEAIEEPIDSADAEIQISSSLRFTDTSYNPQCLIGEEAANLHSSAPYERHWPIVRGHFNITRSNSFQTICCDLERILEYTLVRKLKIPRELFSQFNIVLLVPDVFYRDQTKAIVDIILRQLGLGSVFLLQESVAAVYGAGVPTACVADIGADYIKVACIEEGMLLPQSIHRQYYAGRDMTLLVHRLLRQDSASYEEFRAADDLKTAACRLMQPERDDIFLWKVNEEDQVRISSCNPLLTVAAHSLFHPSLLKIVSTEPKTSLVISPLFSVDPEDYLEDIAETKRAEEVVQPPPVNERLVGLDQLIINSIMSVPTPETRKKLCNSILLVGGGAMLPGIVDALEDKLITTFPEEIERVEVKSVITHSDSEGNKENIQPPSLQWVGGSVIPMLDSAKELWTTRSRWVGEWLATEAKEEARAQFASYQDDSQLSDMCRKWRKDRPLEGGVRHIKEKAVFYW